MKQLTVVACVLSLFAVPRLVSAQEDHSQHKGSSAQVGTVSFETSCKPAVKDDFNHAVAELHSFWFPEARVWFEGVLKTDPDCAIAYWGIALTHWGNPFAGLRSPQVIANGKAAIEKGQTTGSPTPREKGYIDAVAGLFSSADPGTQRARVLAYEKATEALAAANPADTEARIFWALAIDQTALPTDKTFAQNLRAAEILEPLYKKMPNHPGLAHYIIHSFDVPPLAPRALDAARRYAAIAPDAAHALHMPSHTFTRVGFWKESIEANLASATAARKDNAVSEELHALDYQTYAYLQTAQDRAALQNVEKSALVREIPTAGAGNAAPPTAGYYALAATPARYALEREAWAEAAALTPHPSPFHWPDAVTHFARAIGAARSGNVAAARQDVEKLAAIRDTLKAANDAYWTDQVEIQRRGALAWVSLAEGRQDEALTLMRETATLEDATEKAAVTPGPIKPARELLGDMLMQMKRPAEALAEYEATLKKEPNRFRAMYGAAQAATAAGQRQKAAGFYANLLQMAKDADQPGRKELAEARAAAQSK